MSRRKLRQEAVAITASAATPAATVASSNADAELIRLCKELIAASKKYDDLLAQCQTIADEERTERAVSRIADRVEKIEQRIEVHLPPKSMAGAVIVARTAMANQTPWTFDVDFSGRAGLYLAAFLADAGQRSLTQL